MKNSPSWVASYVGIGLLGFFGLFLVVRTWLVGLFETLGPERSADVSFLIIGTACIASGFVLSTFLMASWLLSRFQRNRQTPIYAPTIQHEPIQPRQVITRLPAGNWAGDGNFIQPKVSRDVIELAFSGRPTVTVSRSAFYDALKMPVLKRSSWKHDTNAYSAIRLYLRERGAVDEKGIWNDERREAIRRMAE